MPSRSGVGSGVAVLQAVRFARLSPRCHTTLQSAACRYADILRLFAAIFASRR